MANKLFIYDLETTGLNSTSCSIHQFSGLIVIDNEIKETFDFKTKPFEGSLIEKAALDLRSLTIEDLNKNELSYVELHLKLKRLLSKYVDNYNKKDKFSLVGFNITAFDNNFFRELFNKNNDKFFGSYFWPNSIDCYSLASLKLLNDRPNMENFKLKTVAKYLDIPVNENSLHDANYDIMLTYEIYKKCQYDR